MLTILLVVLVVLLIAGLPHWSHTRKYDLGYFPSGMIGLLLVVLVILLVTGRL